MINADTPYRDIGPVPFAVWNRTITNAGGPDSLASLEAWTAAGDASAVLLRLLEQESSFGTDYGSNSIANLNPLNIRVPDYSNEGNPAGYRKYKSYADNLFQARTRIYGGEGQFTGPNPYAQTTTISDLLNTYAPPRWNDTPILIERMVRRLNGWLPNWEPEEGDGMPEAVTFGRVPMYGFFDKRPGVADKPEGVGWDNLGQRKPKFIVLHRMIGSLDGTDQYFGDPSVPALTDFGVGVESMDGKGKAGWIYQWSDPLGYRSGWASGRVSAPYGDGKRIVDKYGVVAVNRDGVSVEISGNQTTPIDEVSWKEIVHLCSWWADYMHIPYNSKVNPSTGINFLLWHEEFTIGTGKMCPFDVVKALTNRLYNDIAKFLEPFQTSGAQPEPQPEPEPIPEPQYAAPVPVPELVEFSNYEADSMKAVVTTEGDQFIFVNDIVEATKDTPRYQRAKVTSEHIGPLIPAGTQFEVTWLMKSDDGNLYYISPFWSRVLVSDTKRVSDAA